MVGVQPGDAGRSAGHDRSRLSLESAYLINLAIPIFAITLLTRYFEFGFDLLGQSVAFIVAGVILLAGGFGMEFLRRRLVRRMRETGAAT